MHATIRTLDTPRAVELAYDDELTGERITRRFHVRRAAGLAYVRDEGDRQVCSNLSDRGVTLYVHDEADLLPLIRREWRRAQGARRAEAAAFMAGRRH